LGSEKHRQTVRTIPIVVNNEQAKWHRLFFVDGSAELTSAGAQRTRNVTKAC
jgi:hypothetical protein